MRLPGEVGIELVRGCNFHCRMCPVTFGCRHVEYMSLELVRTIAEGLKYENSINIVWLFHFGEPLLHPYFREVLEILYAYQVFRDAYVVMHTNASMLKDEKADDILAIPLIDKLVFSFDGYGDRDSYNELRGNHYDEVLDNIRKFAPRARKFRPELELSTCTIVPKYGEISNNTYKTTKDVAEENLNSIFSPLSVNVEVREMHDYSGNEKLLLSGERKEVGGGCIYVERNSLYINVHGFVAPCCSVFDETFYTASIITSSATEILNCKEWLMQQHMLRLDKRKGLPFCENCSLSIKGNPGEAFSKEYWQSKVDQDEITDREELQYIKSIILSADE